MTILFWNSSPKYPNKAFLVPNLGIFVFFTKFFFHHFCFCTKLCSKANSRTQNSNMTILFSNSTLKIRKSGIFGSKFKDFYFAPNVAIRQIRKRWFQIWQWVFRVTLPNVSIFLFLHGIFAYLKISRVLISKTAIVFFFNSSKKYLNTNFFWKLKSFF